MPKKTEIRDHVVPPLELEHLHSPKLKNFHSEKRIAKIAKKLCFDDEDEIELLQIALREVAESVYSRKYYEENTPTWKEKTDRLFLISKNSNELCELLRKTDNENRLRLNYDYDDYKKLLREIGNLGKIAEKSAKSLQNEKPSSQSKKGLEWQLIYKAAVEWEVTLGERASGSSKHFMKFVDYCAEPIGLWKPGKINKRTVDRVLAFTKDKRAKIKEGMLS